MLARELVPTPVVARDRSSLTGPRGRGIPGRTRKSEYIEDAAVARSTDDTGRRLRSRTVVTRLVQKFREGRAIGAKDDMALVGILSTQIMIDRFINNFRRHRHGTPYSGTAAASSRLTSCSVTSRDVSRSRDEDSFQELGIIDSTGILELVCHLQDKYAIAVGDEEIVPDNLDSISKVARFIDRKQQG